MSGVTAAAVIAALTVFLGLQYNWLGQASEAARERLHKRVEEDARRIAADFNREVQAVYFNFQVDPARAAAGDASELAERYAHWKGNTQFPELVGTVLFVPAGPSAEPSRFDPAEKTFKPYLPDEPADAVVRRIRAERHPNTVMEAHLALASPLYPREKELDRIMVRRTGPAVGQEVVSLQKPPAYMVVFLDRAVLKDKMMPAIANKHVLTEEFNVSATDRSGMPIYRSGTIDGEPDAKAGLFDLSPDKLIFFAERESALRRPGATAVFNQRIESRTLTKATDDGEKVPPGETFTIRMREGDGQRTSEVVLDSKPEGSPWTLAVQHTAGSIDRFVNAERYKSTAIGLAVYLVLVGGILAIVISAQRFARFARRQVDFVSSVSHEFRTPLAVIYSAGENLADGVARDEEQVARYGELIKGEGRRLSAMVEQILQFAGARSGKRKYNFARINVADVIRGALRDAKPLLDEKGFQVECEVPEVLMAERVDAEALSGAIRNLIENSVKYCNGERWLRITGSNSGGRVIVRVEDRGIGIPRADQKRIFEPFFRSKEVVDAQIHGNGLGLPLVKEVAEAHKGSITVRSEAAEGTAFTIEFPTAE